MAEILSQSEIDQLLSNVNKDGTGTNNPVNPPPVQPNNTNVVDNTGKGHIAKLEIADTPHDVTIVKVRVDGLKADTQIKLDKTLKNKKLEIIKIIEEIEGKKLIVGNLVNFNQLKDCLQVIDGQDSLIINDLERIKTVFEDFKFELLWNPIEKDYRELMRLRVKLLKAIRELIEGLNKAGQKTLKGKKAVLEISNTKKELLQITTGKSLIGMNNADCDVIVTANLILEIERQIKSINSFFQTERIVITNKGTNTNNSLILNQLGYYYSYLASLKQNDKVVVKIEILRELMPFLNNIQLGSLIPETHTQEIDEMFINLAAKLREFIKVVNEYAKEGSTFKKVSEELKSETIEERNLLKEEWQADDIEYKMISGLIFRLEQNYKAIEANLDKGKWVVSEGNKERIPELKKLLKEMHDDYERMGSSHLAPLFKKIQVEQKELEDKLKEISKELNHNDKKLLDVALSQRVNSITIMRQKIKNLYEGLNKIDEESSEKVISKKIKQAIESLEKMITRKASDDLKDLISELGRLQLKLQDIKHYIAMYEKDTRLLNEELKYQNIKNVKATNMLNIEDEPEFQFR